MTDFIRAKFVGLMTAILMVGAAAQAVEVKEPALPDTPQGRCARAFLAAFQAEGDDPLRAFEETYRAESVRERRSLEDRLAAVRELRARWKGFTARAVLASGPRDLVLLTQSVGDGSWVELGFMFEAMEPKGLTGISVDGPIDPKLATRAMEPIDDKRRRETVASIVETLNAEYVFPDVARQMGEALTTHLKAGRYDDMTQAADFARAVSEDLQAISRDKHLRVRPRRMSAPAGGEAGLRGIHAAAQNNFGFRKVELLPGNVGYLKLDGFHPSDDAKQVAAAALAFLARADALIFDLRENGGGSPEMIIFLSSYLFEEPTLLNRFFDREGNMTSDSWTREEIPGSRFAPGLPVYVLTSAYTFSAAEEFTYNLQQLKRAVIVGEKTGGGAHPVMMRTLNKRFEVSVPHSRAENPVSKTNWEGVGVKPDMAVASGAALAAALEDATRRVHEARSAAPAP